MAKHLSTLFAPGKGGLLYSLDHAAFVTGRSTADVCTSAEAMYAASIETAEYYGTDLVVVHSDPFLGAEAAGGTVEFPEAGPPVLRARPEIDAIDVHTVTRQGRFALFRDVMKRIARRFEYTDRVIAVSVTGPFSLAGSLIGEADFLARLKNQDDSFTESLLTLATGIVLCFIDELVRTGASVMVAEPLASLVHKKTFRNRVVPPLIQIRDMGDVFFHFCGRIGHLIDAFSDLGPVSISLDDDMIPVMEHTESSIRYVGGLDCMLIFEGSEALMRDRISRLKRKFLPERMLICTGCDMVWNTPPSHGALAMEIIHGMDE